MKRICIHQPDFLPYLGFFHRLVTTDVFIILDDVQFLRRGWHHRDKIKTPHGEQWLTLALQKGDYFQLISEVRLHPDQDRWVAENLNLIHANYQKAPYFAEYFPRIETIYRQGHQTMLALNLAFLDFCLEVFDLTVKTEMSSTFGVTTTKSERLLHLIEATGGTHYITGTGSRSYLDEALFEQHGILVEWQQYDHPVYPQVNGPFMPYLSCLDAIFNCGPQAKDLIRS